MKKIAPNQISADKPQDVIDRADQATIAAVATAPGPAGISIIRISGPAAWAIASRVAQFPKGRPDLSKAVGRILRLFFKHPTSNQTLDDGILLTFKAPHSYTGEDVVEIQGHGGNVAARRLLQAVLAAGARLAQPGEFTRRAFLNGRLDLTQAEAVMDLIQARTDRAAQAARTQLEGQLGNQIQQYYTTLTEICADVEALLDFSEEEVPDFFLPAADSRLKQLLNSLKDLISSWHAGHLLREGALVVISGRPNVGKSSLMNALLARNRAIVSEQPGTTRDSIEENLVLEDFLIRLVDTAGLRETACNIEAEGVARAGELLAQADLNLYLLDNSQPLDNQERAQLARLSPQHTLLAINKSDLPSQLDLNELADWHVVSISAHLGDGLDSLRQALNEKLGLQTAVEMSAEVSARHRDELERTVMALEAARQLLQGEADGLVLCAQKLRDAALSLGRITGRVWSDDLLDTIFSRFCVGK